MNRNNLKKIVKAYCDKFESFNVPDDDTKPFETFKWVVIKHFQDNMILDAEDFGAVLKNLQSDVEWITDGKSVQPFSGLVTLANKHGEAETIRKMFKDLYADDGQDLEIRRKKIYAFMAESDQLVEKYYPGSYRFINGFNTVMAYLWLYNPEHHYHVKMGISKELAECMEVDKDFGTYSDFDLKKYYAFCDDMVEALKELPELMEVHNSRFARPEWADNKEMAEDRNCHILLFDLMHCAHSYGLYNGILVNDRNSELRKLALQYKKKADEAGKKLENYLEGCSFLRKVLQPGVKLQSAFFGTVSLISYDEPNAVLLREDGTEVKMQIQFVISQNNISLIDREWEDQIAPYRDLMNNQKNGNLEEEYKKAEKALKPLLEYLDE